MGLNLQSRHVVPIRRAATRGTRAPRASLPLRVGVSGRIRWEVLDASGRVLRSGVQSNMILDRGMNALMTDTAHGSPGAGGTTYSGYWGGWRANLCVGTGSTAVSPDQTTLVSEVARANTNGGFSSECVDSYSVAGGVLSCTFQMVRVLDFTANYNLTEWGLSELSNANGLINVRELFRDGNGNPTTLSVQSGQQLKLTHILTLTCDFTAAGSTQTFTVTNLGSLQGKGTFYAVGSTTANFRFVALNILNPSNTGAYGKPMTTTNTLDPTAAGGSFYGTDYALSSVNTYTAGSLSRTKTFTWTTAKGNTTWYGVFLDNLAATANVQGGYKFLLTNPTTITKAATNQLTLDFRLTFSRVS